MLCTTNTLDSRTFKCMNDTASPLIKLIRPISSTHTFIFMLHDENSLKTHFKSNYIRIKLTICCQPTVFRHISTLGCLEASDELFKDDIYIEGKDRFICCQQIKWKCKMCHVTDWSISRSFLLLTFPLWSINQDTGTVTLSLCEENWTETHNNVRIFFYIMEK